MKTRVNFCLDLQTQKANARGTAPLYYRVTVRGQTCYLTTGVCVAPADWDNRAKRVLGKTAAAATANASLVKMLDKLTDIWADLERQGKPVTASAIKRLYRRNGAVLSLAELAAMYLKARTALLGTEVGAKTVHVNRVSLEQLTAFLAHTHQPDLRPEEFTAGMAEQFTHWLLAVKQLKRATVNNYVAVVPRVLNWGVRHGHLDTNPCVGRKIATPEAKEIVYLSVAEVAALTAAPQPTQRLEWARDCFVFQCWTGLAYADLAALDVAKCVETGPGGRRLLRVRRAKSTMFKGYECVIPLLPEAERLLAKYGDRLPVIEASGYNKLLKQLGEPLGLGADKMKSHTGRKTAGTLMLNKGIPIEAVSKFLGHSNVAITQRLYAKLLDTTVVDAFALAFGAPTPPPTTAALLSGLSTDAGRVVPMFQPANRLAV